MRHLALAVTLTCSIIALVGCSTFYADKDWHSHNDNIEVTVAVGSIPQRIEFPEQAWSPETRMDFWFTSQGSRILPYTWFTWLEQADSEVLFRSAEHMESLRYLPMPASQNNPSGLPIGFALDENEDTGDTWVGLTCAACHTNQLDYQGKKFLIEGAPTLANFILFYSKLVDALNQTHLDDEKFDRFAKKVLATKYNENRALALRKQLENTAIATAERQVVNELPASYPDDFTSYARLDAFGNIQNAGTAFALNDLSNKNPPTAPVSYPFLWGTHQSDVVQWNASAPNTPVVGPLVRNIGEVVGVFGNLEIKQAPWLQRLLGKEHRYSSSVDMIGLGHLELWVKQLRAPNWPSEHGFPQINTSKAAQGAVLYAANCKGCHTLIARDQQGKNYTASQIPLTTVGTDPAMAWNASHHQANTLILEGSREMVLLGDKFGKTAPAIQIPVNGVIGVVLKDVNTALEAGLIPIEEGKRKTASKIKDALEEFEEQRNKPEAVQVKNKGLQADGKKDLQGLVYKARPLTSIWATAPFLHNGSVPNLWQMLQKPENRVNTFWVGSREYDPIKVGYETEKGLSEFKVLDKEGNIQAGNSNQGHSYGTHLSKNEKWALIEYLKTL